MFPSQHFINVLIFSLQSTPLSGKGAHKGYTICIFHNPAAFNKKKKKVVFLFLFVVGNLVYRWQICSPYRLGALWHRQSSYLLVHSHTDISHLHSCKHFGTCLWTSWQEEALEQKSAGDPGQPDDKWTIWIKDKWTEAEHKKMNAMLLYQYPQWGG